MLLSVIQLPLCTWSPSRFECTFSRCALKWPMKTAVYMDGKKNTEYEVTAVEFFNDFEDKVFARP